MPTEGMHLWLWFWRLSARRQRGEGGPQALTYAEVDSWSRLTCTKVGPEEVDILMDMDQAYLAEQFKEIRAARERVTSQAPASKSGRSFRRSR